MNCAFSSPLLTNVFLLLIAIGVALIVKKIGADKKP